MAAVDQDYRQAELERQIKAQQRMLECQERRLSALIEQQGERMERRLEFTNERVDRTNKRVDDLGGQTFNHDLWLIGLTCGGFLLFLLLLMVLASAKAG